jgi:D-alanine-D-alanine ligase
VAAGPYKAVDPQVVAAMSTLADQAEQFAPNLTLLFVTNIRDGELIDVGPRGISNIAQYYTRGQADAVIQAFQDLGVTVKSFFSEGDFIAHVTDRRSGSRPEIVYTTAEGGSGIDRRALIPSLCGLLGIPVLNSGAHASTLARHKLHANAVLKRFNVRVPETWQFGSAGWTGEQEPAIGTRAIIKPAFESMCIGIDAASVQTVDAGFDNLVQARFEAFSQPVIVQEFVSGDEVGVPLVQLGLTHALQVLEVRRGNGERFGDRPQTFKDHVFSEIVHVPYQATPELLAMIQNAAKRAFDVLGMSGIGRVDFRVDADGRAWAFDTNEAPAPLARTSYGTAMQQLGFPLRRMLAVWLGIGLVKAGLISGIGPEI